jgi:hypothetical protein
MITGMEWAEQVTFQTQILHSEAGGECVDGYVHDYGRKEIAFMPGCGMDGHGLINGDCFSLFCCTSRTWHSEGVLVRF